MAVNLIYAHYSDNVAPNATVSVQTGTAATGYPASNLVDRIPAKPAKLVETTGAWLFNFGAAQRVDWVALPHHNLTAGLEVRIQGNAANAWGAPSLNELITIPAYRDDGFTPGPWLDLTAKAGYLVGGYQYWRLVVVGVNAAAVAIGEVGLISTKRSLNPNISWGERQLESRKIVQHSTDYGVDSIYDLGVTRRSWIGELDSPDSQRTAVRTWWRDARGRARPFFIVPDGDVNECAMVRFADTDLDVQLNVTDRNKIQIGFEEVSRGLVL